MRRRGADRGHAVSYSDAEALRPSEILHRHTGAVLWSGQARDMRHAVELARRAGATLRGADLVGATLRDADLRGADLVGANLRGANLRGANLRGATLWGANLGGADLHEATLWGANLRGADLSRAKLSGARLWGANLGGANGIVAATGHCGKCGWHVLQQGDAAPVFRYGCEVHDLALWTPELIAHLCWKHAEGDAKLPALLTALVAMAREVVR